MYPAEDGGMITALSTGEPGVLAHARAVLEEAGIPYGIEGEVGQLIYGGGNIAFGPHQIRIPAEEAERVEKLFTEEGILQEIAPAAEEEEPPQSSEKMIEEAERLLVASLLIFAAILAPPAFLKAWQARTAYRRESSRSGRLERRIRIVLIGSAFLSLLSWGALLGALANKLAG